VRRFRLVPLLLLAAAFGCAAGVPAGGGPAGNGESRSAEASVRATWKDAPLAGVRVEWRKDVSPGDPGPVAAATTDAQGIARMKVPHGRWFLLAQWRADGNYSRPAMSGDRFSFFGGNPVHLAGGPPREIFLSLVELTDPPAPSPADEPAPAGGGVSGRVLADGVPLPDAHVFAYLRTDTAFRDMGFAASAPTGPDGSFFLDLPPGRYWLVARKRASGGVAGPLRKGDAFGYHPSNPVEVAKGQLVRITLPATTLRLRNTPGYSASSAAASYIEGRILGADGKPKGGVYAALYDNPDLLNRPLYLSEVTGPDGRYRLPVPVPGTYYLGARNGYGGSPAPGDLYGRYEGNPAHSVTVREGDRMTGFDVVVAEVR
jgi:hypothetical protein